jgi:hypothetical protein
LRMVSDAMDSSGYASVDCIVVNDRIWCKVTPPHGRQIMTLTPLT